MNSYRHLALFSDTVFVRKASGKLLNHNALSGALPIEDSFTSAGFVNASDAEMRLVSAFRQAPRFSNILRTETHC